MVTIYVDNQPYEVKDGQNLLQACLSLGFNLPHFCWHPALHSVGACRQCAVKQFRDENDTRGRIVMSCMTPVAEGTRISIDDPEAKAMRASVIEWLMVNHPHDCPVCDEGGECHLQDMTYMTGHAYRRYRFQKRTYRNQNLGPFVAHEMNRCIQCYRCVRFYREYAGGRDLNVFGVHDRVYFGRQADGILESEFSGNLVEVCPTGVFTDKSLSQHYTRKWDLQTAPSVCAHCGLGCNIIPGERYGTLRRVRNRYNGEVNEYFICDRGRYGYEYVNHELRLRAPRPASDALARAGRLLGAGRAIALGSPRASLEANFALRRLVGPQRYYRGVLAAEARLADLVVEILRRGPAAASLADVGLADAVLVLGEDVTNTAPRADLALRQAVRQAPMRLADELKIPRWEDGATRRVIQDSKGPLYIATATATKLDELATATHRAAPDDIARLGQAVAAAVGGEMAMPAGLAAETAQLARAIAAALVGAERPLVLAGTSYGSEAILRAAADVAGALQAAGKQARLFFVVPEVNTLGLALLGGPALEAAREALREGHADTLVVLENDLYRRADADWVDALLRLAPNLIVLDALENATVARAQTVLPVATPFEADGTFVNNEGRAQRAFQVFVPSDAQQGTGARSYLEVYAPGEQVRESWRWLRDLGEAAGRTNLAPWQRLDDLLADLAAEFPALAGALEAAPPATFRLAGQKVPRQPQRYSGRTAMFAHKSVHEPKPTDDPDAPLSFSMEGYDLQPPGALVPRFWAPGWNSEQAVNKFQQEIPGPLLGGNPGVRLLRGPEGAAPALFAAAPEAFAPRRERWFAVPLFHIFGSDERSVLSGGVAERTPSPYLALNEADAASLGVEAGAEFTVMLGGRARRLRLVVLPELPVGVAGLPAGLPGLEGLALPRWLELPQELARG
ncbi:MAG: NADH-quinone oxidoreductase subunit NuoG [Chloroflexota bacterium]